jgi:hypothetical protein
LKDIDVPGVVTHICNPALGRQGRRIASSRPTWTNSERACLKKERKIQM